MLSTSILIDVKEASLSITRLLQDSSVIDLDIKQSLASILESVSELLLLCKKPFEEDTNIKGILHAISAVMSCQYHLTTAPLLLLSFKITAILSGKILVSISKAIELVQLLSSVICMPWLTEYQRTQGYYYIFVSLENSDLLQSCVLGRCQLFLPFGSIPCNQQTTKYKTKCESIMEQQKVILSRIVKRFDVFKACQEIKSLTHRLLDLTIPGRANNSCSDEKTYSIKDISIRLCSHFDLLSEELTILYALEHLDELKNGKSKLESPQNEWIGILVPFQAVSSISFRLFRRFQVYDSLTITAILMLLTDQEIDFQVRYIMSFIRFIIAHMASGHGRSHLEEGFTKLPAKETKIVYNWISADTGRGQVIGCRKIDSNGTLYEIWKVIEPLMLSRLDSLDNLEVNVRRRNIALDMNQNFESYADHLFKFTHIKCLCNDMIKCYPSPWETFNWVAHTDSIKIGDYFSYIQGLLYAGIDTTAFCRKIKQSRKIDDEIHCNDNDPLKAVQYTCLESLANLTKTQAGVETVTQSILDFDLIPDLIKLTLSEEKKIGYNATVILQKMFERPSTFYWFLHNDSAFKIQDLLSETQEIMKYIEFTLTCQSFGLVNGLRRCRDRLLNLRGFPMAENFIYLNQLLAYLQMYLWELSLNDHRLVYTNSHDLDRYALINTKTIQFRLHDFLQLSELVKLQTVFLTNLQAIVRTVLLESCPATEAEKVNCRIDKTLDRDFRAQRTINAGAESHRRIYSLCEGLAILTQLIRRTCAYEPYNRCVKATQTNRLSDNRFLATLIIESALNTLCITNDLYKVLASASSGDRRFDCLKEIFIVEAEIYSMLHDQCSICLPIDDENVDGRPRQKKSEAYESHSIVPNFPRYIIKNALELIHRKPTSALPLIKLMCDLLPDAVNDKIENLSSASQRLRSYWKNALTKLCDDLLNLRHFIISNDSNISEGASIALARICNLFSTSNGFLRRIKSILYQEMNAHVAYAIHLHSTDGMATHKKLDLMQNEMILRRWLNFTTKLTELDDIRMYFTQALDRIELPVEMMQTFTTSDSLSVMLNVDSVLDTLNKAVYLNSERKELYRERDGNVQDTMYPINQANNKANIGGGKAYNRNEFRAVHAFQSVNASRPPSVHVDDFSFVQS